jgi:hypothetical protein
MSVSYTSRSFTTLRTGAFGGEKIQWRHTLKLLYTHHTHQNYAKCIAYEFISPFKGPSIISLYIKTFSKLYLPTHTIHTAVEAKLSF